MGWGWDDATTVLTIKLITACSSPQVDVIVSSADNRRCTDSLPRRRDAWFRTMFRRKCSEHKLHARDDVVVATLNCTWTTCTRVASAIVSRYYLNVCVCVFVLQLQRHQRKIPLMTCGDGLARMRVALQFLNANRQRARLNGMRTCFVFSFFFFCMLCVSCVMLICVYICSWQEGGLRLHYVVLRDVVLNWINDIKWRRTEYFQNCAIDRLIMNACCLFHCRLFVKLRRNHFALEIVIAGETQSIFVPHQKSHI